MNLRLFDFSKISVGLYMELYMESHYCHFQFRKVRWNTVFSSIGSVYFIVFLSFLPFIAFVVVNLQLRTFFPLLFGESGRGGGLVARREMPMWEWHIVWLPPACTQGTCLGWEWSSRPFCAQAAALTTEHQPGPFALSLFFCFNVTFPHCVSWVAVQEGRKALDFSLLAGFLNLVPKVCFSLI